MVQSILSALDIVNLALELAGRVRLQAVQEKSIEWWFYREERNSLIERGEYNFAIKEVDIATTGTDDRGFFVLPTDYIRAYNPKLLEIVGDKARLRYSGYCFSGGDQGVFQYYASIEDTSLFSEAFVSALVNNLSTRFFAYYNNDTQYTAQMASRALQTHFESHQFSVPLKVIRP